MAWWYDFEWRARGVTVKATGTYVPLNFSLIKNTAKWLAYFLAEKRRNIGRKRTFTIACMPALPRPWYLIWPVITRAGGRVTSDPAAADAVFYFEDRTRGKPPVRPDPFIPDFNFRCVDVSKSRIARDFHIIFGYPLAVQPERHNGKMVIKSEINGTHDGRIIKGPVLPDPGFAYQKLVNNRIEGEQIEDFYCPAVRGEIPLVYVRRRARKQRFSNKDKAAVLLAPTDIFSVGELQKIRFFCAAIGLDWGCLDILRDNNNGRIYIVDVNKTLTGPPAALSLNDKLRSVDILAAAFAQALKTGDSLAARTIPPVPPSYGLAS